MALFSLIILVFAISIVVMGATIVPQEQEFTVERLGRYTHTLEHVDGAVFFQIIDAADGSDQFDRVAGGYCRCDQEYCKQKHGQRLIFSIEAIDFLLWWV